MRALGSAVLLSVAAAAPGAEPTGADEAAMRYGHSAQRLIGAEAHERGGERLGRVKDLLIGPAGRVSGLLVGRLPVAVTWR
ncbi:MAG TPA: PRC-barrel domain-containing protein [Burkholderiales bacterium]